MTTATKTLTPSQLEACREAAASFCRNELAYCQEYHPAVLLKPEFSKKWAEFEASQLASQTERGLDMLFPFSDDVLKGACDGLFDPRNLITRNLFTGITGIALPRGQGATDAILADYFGESLVAYRDKQDTERRAKADARQAVEDAEKAKADAKEAERMAGVESRCRAGENVGGDELVDLCRKLGVFVHPRSVKLWRDKIAAICLTSGRVYGKQTSTQTAVCAYRDCQAKLLPTAQTVEA